MFGFNKSKEQEVPAQETNLQVPLEGTENVNRPIVHEEDFIDTSDPNGEDYRTDHTTPPPSTTQTRTVIYSMGMPIDGVYIYMEKDWEEEGVKDATLNPDISFRDSKVELIKHGLTRRFEMTRLKYNKMIREYEAQIDTLNQFGFIGTMNTLMAEIDTCKEHLQKITELENRFRQDAPELRSMTDSYKRGFANGVAIRLRESIDANNKEL